MVKLTPEMLLQAYASGIFPMAEDRDDPGLFWVDPEWRGHLPLDDFHIPKRLAKTVRRDQFQVSIDHNFRGVMEACARSAPGRENTWINRTILELYCKLFEMGFAHSVECRRDGILVGGLYGISLGAAFFGESMFSTVRDASKVALVHLVARLRFGGYRLLDTQFVTDHLRQFGAEEIPRSEYLEKLEDAVERKGDFYLLPEGLAGSEVMQSITQMS